MRPSLAGGVSIGLAAMLAAGAVPAARAAETPARIAPAIEVLTASYSSKSSSVGCSALQFVNTRCRGRIRCGLPVSDSVCDAGERPPPALFSSLSVSFRCSATSKVRSASAERPFELRLSCFDMLR